jgi:hypothetical protein
MRTRPAWWHAVLVVLLAADGAVPSLPLAGPGRFVRTSTPTAPKLAAAPRPRRVGVSIQSVESAQFLQPATTPHALRSAGSAGTPVVGQVGRLAETHVQPALARPSGPPLIASDVPLTRSLIKSLLECDLSVDGEDLLSGPRLGAGGVLHASLPLLNSTQEVTLSHFAHLFFNISAVRQLLIEAAAVEANPPSLHDIFQELGFAGNVREEVSAIELQLLEVRSRAAYGKLFRHNLGLIHQELNKHKTCTALERADLWQEGTLGLLRAIQYARGARAERGSRTRGEHRDRSRAPPAAC